MATYSYTRVSTGRQAEEGESLGAQQRRVEGYAQMNDLRVDRHPEIDARAPRGALRALVLDETTPALLWEAVLASRRSPEGDHDARCCMGAAASHR